MRYARRTLCRCGRTLRAAAPDHQKASDHQRQCARGRRGIHFGSLCGEIIDAELAGLTAEDEALHELDPREEKGTDEPGSDPYQRGVEQRAPEELESEWRSIRRESPNEARRSARRNARRAKLRESTT